MFDRGVEEEIKKLGAEISRIYFDAKHELIQAQDSHGERFTAAARTVRAFWKKVQSSQTP
jgi:hypothetical protein